MIALAFYSGQGRWYDRLVRWATRSKFSHVELVRIAGENRLEKVEAWSASSRDGGVRWTTLDLTDSTKWTIMPVAAWAKSDAIAFVMNEAGRGYDWLAVLSFIVLPMRRNSSSRWFCSELCAWALGLDDYETLSPADLFRRVRDLNDAYHAGRLAVGQVD